MSRFKCLRSHGVFREALLEIEFLPADHPEARSVEWRELFGRAGLTAREARVVLARAAHPERGANR